ncbi:MAG: DUF2147 domain-containing protein [Bacteroidales bacterium]|nr:DUF2147 domain-containing protein [Bacteroidales bacterium]
MNKKVILNIAIIIFINLSLFSQKADELIGKYHMPNKLDIEIFKSGNKYYGKVIALNGWENGKTTDYKNPDEEKRNEPLVGKIILKDLEFDNEEKIWTNGTLYGPEKGMFVDFKVTEMQKNKIEVVASKFFIRKTMVWKKIKS